MTDIYERLKNATSVGSTREQLAGTCEAALHALWERDAEIDKLRGMLVDAMTEIDKLRGEYTHE